MEVEGNAEKLSTKKVVPTFIVSILVLLCSFAAAEEGTKQQQQYESADAQQPARRGKLHK